MNPSEPDDEFDPPDCPKCKQKMDDCCMEAVMAPPAPTLYLTTWSCTNCKGKK